MCGAVLAYEAVLLSYIIKISSMYLKQIAWEVFGISSDFGSTVKPSLRHIWKNSTNQAY